MPLTCLQGFSCIPIEVATKLSQLDDNLGTAKLVLTDAAIVRLNAASAVDLGFPRLFYKEEPVRLALYGGFNERIEKRQPKFFAGINASQSLFR